MAYQVKNIIIGAAALYVSESDSLDAGWDGGPALPAGPITSGRSVAEYLEYTDPAIVTPVKNPDWRHAGFTSEGLELSYEPDFGDVEVDQLLDSAKLYKQSMRVTLNTTLVEATLENLLMVWAQPGSDLTTTGEDDEIGIAAGGLGDEPVERALVAVGPGPRSATGDKRERVYHARRVLSVESSAHALRRNEATTFPVSFRLLPDPNFGRAEYGIIRDRVV